MKVVRLLEYGGQLVFDNVPTPTMARDEILVKIKSTAVNHLDLVKASGTARQILPIDLPWLPGKWTNDPDSWWCRRCGRLCSSIGIACRRHRHCHRQRPR